MEYNVIQITDGVWTIEDGNVRMYLVDGGSGAILIDTGNGSGDLRALVASILKKDLKKDLAEGGLIIINTHFHGDHTSANGQFPEACFVMNEADLEAIRPACPDGAQIRTVREGDVVQAGTAALTVIEIPGHTPGSIALLDDQHRILFSADSVAKHFPVYMQFPGQDTEKYLASLRKMKGLQDRYDRICPCHGELEVEQTYMDKMIHCCEGILDGSIRPGTCLNSEGTLERAYWYEDVSIFHQ